MPVFMVTNDDGITAPGLRQLAESLRPLGKVVVVAPDRPRSSTGHAITLHKPLRIDAVDLVEGVEAYHVNGTPSDCVKLAVEALLQQRPDLVLSGINAGPNLSTDVLYSGTVSGAVEGAIHDVPSVAISLVYSGNAPDYRMAASFAASLASLILEKGLPRGTLLNVNVPDVEPQHLKGVRVTRLGTRRYQDVLHKRTDPRGRLYYWMAGRAVDLDDAPDTDAIAVRSGYISVTPIHFDLTHYKLITELEAWPWHDLVPDVTTRRESSS